MDSLEFQLDKFVLKVPKDRQYTRKDLWIMIENNVTVIGVTDFFQTQLGDILFFTPEKIDSVKTNQLMGMIESIKANMEILSPVEGKIIAFNESLDQHPEILSIDPYGKGWIVKVDLSSQEIQSKDWLSPEDYYSIMRENAEKAAR